MIFLHYSQLLCCSSLTERFLLDTKYLGEFNVRKSSLGGFEIIS